jgi:hypothetical protein
VQLDLYPTCIQAQRTVRASKSHEISNHITRHSAVNIGRIRSIQLTNRSTIFRWVRWLMGLMVYRTAMKASGQRSALHHAKASES